MLDPSARVEELTGADRKALNEEIQLGHRICDFYLDREWDGGLETLDELFNLWLRDPQENKPSANEVALGIGALTGEYLRSEHGCRWVVVTGQSGCELGMIKETTGWQLFPRHWIAKRIDPQNAGHHVIKGIVGALQRDGVIDG